MSYMWREHYEPWQIARVREAYTSVGVPASSEPGFDGMVAEMRWGLENLDAPTRAEADRRVFHAIFFGTAGIGAIRFAYDRAPEATRELFARVSPAALGYLVGDLTRSAADENHVRSCRFREAGGEALCTHVCKEPTEAFVRENLLPLRLAPSRTDASCTWTWGARALGGTDA